MNPPGPAHTGALHRPSGDHAGSVIRRRPLPSTRSAGRIGVARPRVAANLNLKLKLNISAVRPKFVCRQDRDGPPGMPTPKDNARPGRNASTFRRRIRLFSGAVCPSNYARRTSAAAGKANLPAGSAPIRLTPNSRSRWISRHGDRPGNPRMPPPFRRAGDVWWALFSFWHPDSLPFACCPASLVLGGQGAPLVAQIPVVAREWRVAT